VPPNWTPYIAVENTDAAMARARELGGTVIAGPIDVYDQGRMAFLQDPTGAVFAVWQAMKGKALALLTWTAPCAGAI